MRALQRSSRGALGLVALALMTLSGQLEAGTRIAVDSTSSAATGGAVPSLTWPHTITGGSDRFLAVSIVMDNGQATGIDYDGIALALIDRYTAGVHTVEMWGLVAPPVGTADIVATFDGARNAIGGATAFDGVSQTTPTGPLQGAHGTSSPATVTLPSSPSELVLDVMITDANSTVTAGAAQSEEWRRTASWDRLGVGSVEQGAASVTMSWTLTDVIDDWTIAAVALAPAPHRVQLPIAPTAAAAGDLSGDGRADVVAVHPTIDQVSISIARGDGSFEPPRYVAAGPAPIDVALGDVDGNGSLDVVVASTDGSVHIMRGDGDGSVFDTVRFAAASGPGALALLDLEGDGSLDIALADTDSYSIVLLGLDDAVAVTSVGVIDLGAAPTGLAAGDLDGDGRTDLIAAVPGTGSGIVILGNDLGGFSPPSPIAVGSSTVDVALGDLDGDGAIDAAFADDGGNEAIVLLGNGDGSFGAPRGFGVGTGPTAIVVGHLDGDCALDIATANTGSRDVSVLSGDGGGALGPARSFAIDGAPTDVSAVPQPAGPTELAVSVPEIDSIVLLGQDDLNGDGPVLDLTATVQSGSCADFRVELAPTTTEPAAASHELTLGDGSDPIPLAPLASAVYAYPDDGTYLASLVAYDAGGACVARADRLLELGSVRAASGGPYRLCAGAIETSLADFHLAGSVEVDGVPSTLASSAWDVPGDDFELVNDADGEATLQIPVKLAPIAVAVRFSASIDECVASVWDLAVLDAAAAVPLPAAVDICRGDDTVLDAGPGRASYLWSTGATSPSITVSPTAETVFSVRATDADGCFTDAATTVFVHDPPAPAPTATPPAVCPGETTVLDAGAAYATYAWSTGAETRTVAVAPAAETRYDLTVADGYGCTVGASITVAVLPDTPVTAAVSVVHLTKDGGPALRVSFSDIGAPGYNLHAAADPTLLAAAPPIAWSDVSELVVEPPWPGLAFYAVRGASACTATSGP